MIFSEAERDTVYKAIYSRRDVRGQFKPDPIPEEVLTRILSAAHHAPSVGFMQPWDFIVVNDPSTKQKIKAGFQAANAEASIMFDQDRKAVYDTLKLEGITEAPIGICITCDRTRTGSVVIGRTANPEMDLHSSVCAVQNLWLAARAENLGVGWVSIIHHNKLRDALKIPDHIVPIAYLCIGYVTFFHEKPELEKAGWLPRTNIETLIHTNQWGAIA